MNLQYDVFKSGHVFFIAKQGSDEHLVFETEFGNAWSSFTRIKDAIEYCQTQFN